VRATLSKEDIYRCGDGWKCVYFNARIISNKMGEFKAWIGTWNYDVVAITETWLAQGQEWLTDVPSYRCFDKIREV